MKVDTMRFVDRYAGIPLCAVVTAVKKLVSGKRRGLRPEKILFIELSEMGSAILADPAMRKISERFDAKLFFLIFKKNKPSLDLLGTVKESNIYTIDSSNLFSIFTDTIGFLKWARKKGIDTVVDLELFSRYTALLSGLSGASSLVGFYNFYGEGLYRGDMLTHKVLYNPHIHISENFMAMINSLSEDSDGRPYSKTRVVKNDIVLAKAKIDPAVRESVFERVKAEYPTVENMRLFLVNPNASELLPQRRWGRDKYAVLIDMICDYYQDALVLITGAASEREEAEILRKKSSSARCVNFAGRLKLSELTALYDLSCIMVSNDSGPAHFAAVTKMPTVIIFGPETPKLYGSLGDTSAVYAGLACSPCVSAANHRKTPCVNNVCLQVISPAEVFERLKDRLNHV